MIRFFFNRLLVLVPTFIGITIVAFVFIRILPGDPVSALAGEHGVSPERHAELLAQLGFDQPLWKQYVNYVVGLAHGDLGYSFATKRPVLTEFFARFPATVELALCAILLAILVGVPAGIVAAVKRGTIIDQATMGTALVGYSMPIFWWGLLLIMFVSVRLGLLPVSGRIDLINYSFDQPTGFMTIDALLSDQPGAFLDALRHLILPAIVLGTVPLAVIARMTRSSMLEVLSEDYVRTARAKGLSPARVIGVHALRNALLPVVTVIGLSISSLMAGAVLTETIFSWPGVGHWLIDSIGRRDYPALQGGVLLISAVVVLVNLIVDLVYGIIDPRISHGR
jgi:dipeptide transport system permease protein